MTSTAASATAGLKEFADGDAALFNGTVMLDFNSQEDFETEFHRLLGAGSSANVSDSSNKHNNKQTVYSESTTTNSPVNAIVDELKFIIMSESSYSTDFFAASPPDTLKSSTIEPVKFVEDPLSAHLNHNNTCIPPSVLKPTEPRSKRGRPKHLRFTAVQYDKTTSNTTNSNLNNSLNTANTIRTNSLKFRHRHSDSDCYSPAWIRGRGAEREGLCPLCDPPVWFRIKQSAYWYHLNFFHGISAATGKPYAHPISYRFASIVDTGKSRVEGHCGQCLHWIFLSADFDGEQSTEAVEKSLCFTTWYKHAQKCHHRTRNFQIPDELTD